ncbi:MFS transporter [Streptomyces marianii]|uniref:MFS transporter n=1 Tax=Streptomyces marianii TaxID=1817406 RepID=A0A5R9E4M7_9ACTN|nr:MFS transporter [Streptomyces marianii]TLQ43214.1 MFS transporter [Streptomyces marianii]
MEKNSEPSDDTSAEGSSRVGSRLVARGLIPERGPKRTLALATFVNEIGNGLFMIGAALYFTRSVGLSVTQVGLGMGIAALAGLLSGVPVGHLADRRGPRETYLITICVEAVAMAALVFVHTFWLFVIVVCVIQLASSASQAARGPLVRGFAGPNPTKFRSYMRALSNLAGASGGVAAGIAVQLDTRAAYLALVLGNALTFVACAAVISRLPSLPPVKAPERQGRWIALRDTPFVTVTALDGILSLQGYVLVFALPLWIVEESSAPRWLVSVCVLVNTMLVVCFQVRASRGIDTNTAATRAVRRASLAFLLGMALIATTGEMSGKLAAVVIVTGVAVHTVGELWHAAASFELSFGLAPRHAQGQYSGLSGLGHGFASAAAPSVLGLLCITWGAPGWLVMGAVFVVVGLIMPYVVRWAERTREPAPAEQTTAA